MSTYVRRTRIVVVVLVCAMSVLSGLMLIFRLGTPTGVSMLATHEILAMLGLMFLPLATLWAYFADLKASRRAVAAEVAAAVADAARPTPVAPLADREPHHRPAEERLNRQPEIAGVVQTHVAPEVAPGEIERDVLRLLPQIHLRAADARSGRPGDDSSRRSDRHRRAATRDIPAERFGL